MLCVMTKYLKDAVEVVKATDFNKEFPPMFVNGEFVYNEKPMSEEERR